MPPWSSLQRQLYALIDPSLNFQIHCRVYRMKSERGSTDLPRYWITVGKDIIWDYPRQFVSLGPHPSRQPVASYPYLSDISAISAVIREYIDTPLRQLLSKHFDADHWGLVNILRAADRRVGSRQWPAMRSRTKDEFVLAVLDARRKARSASSRLPRLGPAFKRGRGCLTQRCSGLVSLAAERQR
jgi:hypothetical protein